MNSALVPEFSNEERRALYESLLDEGYPHEEAAFEADWYGEAP